jgi:hypothetical protein
VVGTSLKVDLTKRASLGQKVFQQNEVKVKEDNSAVLELLQHLINKLSGTSSASAKNNVSICLFLINVALLLSEF